MVNNVKIVSDNNIKYKMVLYFNISVEEYYSVEGLYNVVNYDIK